MRPRHRYATGLVVGVLAAGCGARTTSLDSKPANEVEKNDARGTAVESYIAQHGAHWGESYAFSGCVMVRGATGESFDKCYGQADRSSGRQNTADTVFRVASITKQFTAAAVLTLVDDGQVALSDTICEHVKPCSELYRDVTIHHLLTHTSGIPNYTNFEDYNDFKGQARTPQELYAYFSPHELEFAPGAKFEYSNSGYALLGMLIESVSGQSYGSYLKARLFDPVGLEATAYAPDAYPATAARGYHPGDDDALGETHTDFQLSVGFSAGGIVSTLSDLVRWDAALRGPRVLSSQSRDALFSPDMDRYAYGWQVDVVDGHRVASHSGQVSGFSTHIARALDSPQLVVVWANNDQFGSSGLGRAALAIIDGREPPIYQEEQLAALDEPARVAFEGVYRLDPASEARAIDSGVLPSDLEAVRSIELKVENDQLRFLWVQVYGTAAGAAVIPRWGMYFRPLSKRDGRVVALTLRWDGFDLQYTRVPD